MNKLIRISLFLPFVWIAFLIFKDKLGAEPTKFLNHKFGHLGIWFLYGNLFLGNLRSILGSRLQLLNDFGRERRWLGVVGFSFLILHVSFYFLLEALEKESFLQLLTKRYLNFGLLGFTIVFFLALTSNNYSVRILRKKWKLLHRLVYFAFIATSIHVLLIEKTDLIYYGSLSGILLLSYLIRIYKNLPWKKDLSKKDYVS